MYRYIIVFLIAVLLCSCKALFEIETDTVAPQVSESLKDARKKNVFISAYRCSDCEGAISNGIAIQSAWLERGWHYVEKDKDHVVVVPDSGHYQVVIALKHAILKDYKEKWLLSTVDHRDFVLQNWTVFLDSDTMPMSLDVAYKNNKTRPEVLIKWFRFTLMSDK